MRTIKRITSMFVVLSMIMTFIPNVIVSAETTFTGDGTETSPYIISTAEDMKALSTSVNGGESYEGKYFKVADSVTTINLTTEGGYEPIGNEFAKPFKGTFDGNNKEFALTLSMSEKEYVGLFGYNSGVIKNVITSGTVAGGSKTAGVAAYMFSSSDKIINCHNKAEITGNEETGGICGKSSGGRIINCSNSASVNANRDVGGIVGSVEGVGKVVNCINSGSVQGNSYAGGIVGYSWSVKITNCVNDGAVSKKADSGKPVGGIAGTNGEYLTIENCYYNADKNTGVYDIGHTESGDAVEEENCKKTAEELKSESTLEALNLYANKNMVDGYSLLYWKVNDGVMSFTAEKPTLPFTITNNASDYVTVAENAKSGDTVTITPKVADYFVISELTAEKTDGTSVSIAESNGTYTFTMPESDVTIDATTDIKLSKVDGVYQITSADDMKILSNAVNNGYNTTGKTFKVADSVTTINLTTEGGYKPIGKEGEKKFKGTFDGNNKEFALTLSMPENSYVGLFGYNNGVVKNVITSGTVTGKNYVAGVAADIPSFSGKTINCHNKAEITGGYVVGGIVGMNGSGRIINCSNSASVNANQNVGGITGGADGSSKVTNCINSGSVQGDERTGGIVGNSWSVEITNCVNDGDVSKKTDSGYPVGGIAGYDSEYLTIENCYYNADKNTGVYDIGHTESGDAVEEENCKKTAEELVSESTLEVLNSYARQNKTDGYALLYWKQSDGVILLTDERPSVLCTITNNAADYITVAENAKSGDTVTITLKELSYEKVTNIEVKITDGQSVDVTALEDGKTYTFEMPENDVEINVSVELTLKKDGSIYLISSLDELIAFSRGVNSGSYSNANAKLTADIAVSTEKGFVPIGTKENPYKGSFYGDGHTLTLDIKSGVAYDDTTATGLFGVVKGAYIREVILKGSVDGGDDTNSYTGALIGAVDTPSTYVYCVYSEVSVSGSGYVGGMTGYGNDDRICYRNVIVNGTVQQKDTSENKKAVGMFTGIGNRWGSNYYYNSDKSDGAFDLGYYYNGELVSYTRGNKNTSELFSEDTLEEFCVYSMDYGYLYFDFVKENDVYTVRFVKECPIALYSVTPSDSLSYAGIDYATRYSRSGKTAVIELRNAKYINEYIGFDAVKSVKGIKVTDDRGNEIEIEKTGKNEYQFVMPERDVTVTVLYEYNIDINDDGEYCIGGANDLLTFASIVANGETKANAKVTAKEINIRNLDIYDDYEYYFGGGLIQSYEGVFDGNGAKIKWEGYIFRETNNAVIKNLNVENENGIYSGLVYEAYNTQIDNCNVYIHDGYYQSGIAYYAMGSTITNCSVTAESDTDEFGGIVNVAGDNVIIANCILTTDSDIDANYYGGIVCVAYGATKIYNCVNEDMSAWYNDINSAGAIVGIVESPQITLDNNFYKEYQWNEVGRVYSYDYGVVNSKNSHMVNYQDYYSAYIPVMLNEYVKNEENKIDGVTFNKWSYDEYDEKTVFADNNYPEIYAIKQDGVEVSVYTSSLYSENTYGAFEDDKVYVYNVPDGAEISITDENNNVIEFKEDDGDYVFKMPACSVTISVVMDTGIEETKEIDGKNYVVVKTADDFVKAITSVANGNNALNIYIENDIELTSEYIAKYPVYSLNKIVKYNGIFEGAGHTIKFDGLTNSADEEEPTLSMLNMIGENGIVKNVTVDGTISSDGYAASIAFENYGIILNCNNKAEVNGNTASGIVNYNDGIIENCINNGNITGTSKATAVVDCNDGLIYCVFNQGTVTGASSNVMVGTNNGNVSDLIDLTGSDDDRTIQEIAAYTNSNYERILLMVKLGIISIDNNELYTVENAAEWSVDESEMLVFADEENAPYYYFEGFDGEEIHKAGETVEITLDSTMIEEGFELSDVVIRRMFADEQLNAEIVSDKENTYSFIMPAGVCKAEIIKEAEGLTKDDDGYYLVGTLDELMKVKSTIETGNNAVNIRLTNDIEGYVGTPIGGDYGFDGIFDGGNYSITVNMDGSETDYSVYGLFGTLNENSVVKNLTIKGTILANSNKLGAVAGESYGAIINCTNYATLNNEHDDYTCTGGIVGYVQSGNDYISIMNVSEDEEPIFSGLVRGCKNYGSISADGENGGIVGCCENGIFSSHTATIENCINNGDIDGEYAGGIVSYCVGFSDKYASIKNCVNNGLLQGYDDVGGIVSDAAYTKIDSCKNNGEIETSENGGGIVAYTWYGADISNCQNNAAIQVSGYAAGGIIALAEERISVVNCINNGDVSSTGEYSGGILGISYDNMIIENCYNSGNVTGKLNVYAIALHDDYPHLYMYSAETEDDTYVIKNCFYIQNETVNTGLKSSNVSSKDNSEAVTQEDIASGYVLGKLNSGVLSGMKNWTEENGAVVFGDSDDENVKYYYEISINKNIVGGTITADKACAKAGEIVTLTITPDVEGKTAVITGVELDENNSFVMPDNTVRIDAKFGDGFAATEKDDVIELSENVKAEDIVLADYVKFVNDDITRDFGFAVAEGSALPDGMRLSYGRIVGTPTKAGTYTVVIDVTDPNGIELMALDSDIALGNSQLTLTLNVEKTYKISISKTKNGSVLADKEYAKAGESVKLIVKANNGYMLEQITGVNLDENNTFVMPENDVAIDAVFKKDSNVTEPVISGEESNDGKYIVEYFVPEGVKYCLICAEYTDGILTKITTVSSDNDTNNGEFEVEKGKNTKVMLWDNLSNMKPLCDSYVVK